MKLSEACGVFGACGGLCGGNGVPSDRGPEGSLQTSPSSTVESHLKFPGVPFGRCGPMPRRWRILPGSWKPWGFGHAGPPGFRPIGLNGFGPSGFGFAAGGFIHGGRGASPPAPGNPCGGGGGRISCFDGGGGGGSCARFSWRTLSRMSVAVLLSIA